MNASDATLSPKTVTSAAHGRRTPNRSIKGPSTRLPVPDAMRKMVSEFAYTERDHPNSVAIAEANIPNV
jgi:hypothetical protein